MFTFAVVRKISKFFMYICYHYKLDLSGLAKTETCYKGGKGTSCKLAPAKVVEFQTSASISIFKIYCLVLGLQNALQMLESITLSIQNLSSKNDLNLLSG